MITFPLLGKAGRLGNQLWQIASTIGIARARGEEVSFPDWAYRPYFSLPDEFFTDDNGTDASTLVPHMDRRCAQYLQDFNLWKDVQDEIQEYLSPSELVLDYFMENHQWLLTTRPLIGVHVRRGDNAFDPGTPDKYLYHPLRSNQYYQTAIDSLPADIEVVVFSDDIPWCEQNMPYVLDRPCHFFHGGTPRPKEHEPDYETAPITDWIDLVGLALTEHHILSNSTYAWWGAFLSGDPHPFYPSNWFGKNLDYIDASLMFPDGWVQVHDPTVVA